jgi:hypothetical protein
MPIETRFATDIYRHGELKCVSNAVFYYAEGDRMALMMAMRPDSLKIAVIDFIDSKPESVEAHILTEKDVKVMRGNLAAPHVLELLRYTDEGFADRVVDHMYYAGLINKIEPEVEPYPAFATPYMMPGSYIARRLEAGGWLVAGGERNAFVAIMLGRRVYIYSAGDVMLFEPECAFEPPD